MEHLETREVERRLTRFVDRARRAKLKLTPQRLEIFRAVASREDHPTAEAVHRAVQVSMPTVSLDTVYRTLWTLTDLGLVNTLGPRQDSVRFDANVEDHHHYMCVRCGLVRDFQDPALPLPEVPEAVTRFGRVISAHVEVRGVCAHCADAAP